jgi:hypothetical protein
MRGPALLLWVMNRPIGHVSVEVCFIGMRPLGAPG